MNKAIQHAPDTRQRVPGAERPHAVSVNGPKLRCAGDEMIEVGVMDYCPYRFADRTTRKPNR
jgi:hypothetical protein